MDERDELAFRLWCFLSGKGYKVQEFRNEFDAGIPVRVQVEPDDLVQMVKEFGFRLTDEEIMDGSTPLEERDDGA